MSPHCTTLSAMHLLDLADDVLISIIHRLSLWDARSLASACPPLAPLIASETKRVVSTPLQHPDPLSKKGARGPSFCYERLAT